jgi:CRP/FNR family cyclic AMP-dependent transcriptional regulator
MNDATAALTKTYPAGTVLFEEYDPGSRMFVIRRGKVKIARHNGEHEIVLALLGPGEFFGEMALLEGLPRSASATVLEEADLVEVDGRTFEEMVRGNSEIAIRIMRKLASRVRELDRRLQHLLLESGVGRAVEVLRWLLPSGVPSGKYVRLVGKTTHVDIASHAGISAAEAREVIARLERAGIMRVDGSDVLVADMQTLDDFSNYLDLKRKYDPEPGRQVDKEATKDGEQQALKRLLKALHISVRDIKKNEAALATQYNLYQQLKRRFHDQGEHPW